MPGWSLSPLSFVDFGVNAVKNRIGVVALLQQHNAFDGVGIVDDLLPSRLADERGGFADLAEANLRPLRDGGNVLDLDGRAVLGLDDGVLDVLHAGEEADRLHVDLLRALLDEAAAAVGVVVGDLLLDLADAQPIRDQLLRVELDLVLLGRPAEAGDIDHAGDALEGFFQRPVFERLLLHHVVGGVGAFQRVPVDLSDRAPVGAHLRNKIGGQADHAEPLQHVLAVDVAGGVVVEDQHQAGQAGQRGGAQMREMGNAGHLNLNRHGDLALDLFSGAARPLGDDLHVVVGYVGVGLDGQRAEADNAPGGEHNHCAEDQPAVLEREIDECANHLLVPRGFE